MAPAVPNGLLTLSPHNYLETLIFELNSPANPGLQAK